jgi:methylated-DNA-[protein]-cysteine S-methyltransferase
MNLPVPKVGQEGSRQRSKKHPKEPLRISRSKLSPWQKKVYRKLQDIPAGYVVTYGELARALGSASPRAVGQALRANPFSPAIPCHRVVGAGGRLLGYMGSQAPQAQARKRALLQKEAVLFERDGRVSPRSFFWFPKV